MIKRFLVLATAAVAALSVSAFAAPEHERIRGTVSSLSADTLTVHTTTGKNVPVMLGGDTKYLKVEKSGLSNIEKDSYIWTATKQVGPKLVALEVVIFPASMRGTGDGHYPWDRIRDTTVSGGRTTTSMMTILVPKSAPVVTFAPGAMSDVTKGTVFVVATNDEGNVTANVVAVGSDGVKPPM